MKLKTLEDYPDLSEQISNIEEMIEVLKSAREATTQIMDGMPKGSGGYRNQLESYTAKLMEWVERLAVSTLEYVEQKTEVDDWLMSLNPDERMLIKAKYINRKPNEKVTWLIASQRAHCSESQPYKVMDRLKERGLLDV